ncbi:MAG TPA: XRE family transcriptional regulator [Coriobacteriia bacterium]|nr:XRE family transcriptional regulator [Coriobacteriia bacterium]
MLGEKLMKLRKKQGYSQQDVATLLAITRQTISNWESNQGAPSIDKAKELAALYKIGLDDLVSDEVDVALGQETPSESKDLHILSLLKGRTCRISYLLDRCGYEWDAFVNPARPIQILDATEDWLKIEYESHAGIKKETVTRLVDTSTIGDFVIIDEER